MILESRKKIPQNIMSVIDNKSVVIQLWVNKSCVYSSKYTNVERGEMTTGEGEYRQALEYPKMDITFYVPFLAHMVFQIKITTWPHLSSQKRKNNSLELGTIYPSF